MIDKLSLVKMNRLFENIPESVINDCVIPRGGILSLDRGEDIFLPLDEINTVFILLSGKVKLTYCMEDGGQNIKNILFPGNIIGIDLICTRTRRSPYQAAAVEKCEIFSFPADIILKPGVILETHRTVCLTNLLLIISHANMQNEYRLAILTRNSLRERIIVYLTMQASRMQMRTFTIPFDREDMASYLRVNRSALSHELSLMRREGIIDFRKNTFTLIKKGDSDSDISIY